MDIAQPKEPSFGKWMGSMWLYTVLRFGLFFALWGILLLTGLEALFAALIALVLSVPLSLVLLAKPRQRFTKQLELRVQAQRAHKQSLATQLDPEGHDADE
ncbi:MAG: DUF4229 domain-containing protein [Jatrophihabitans sp.]